jgi:hypothetical protein
VCVRAGHSQEGAPPQLHHQAAEPGAQGPEGGRKQGDKIGSHMRLAYVRQGKGTVLQDGMLPASTATIL